MPRVWRERMPRMPRAWARRRVRRLRRGGEAAARLRRGCGEAAARAARRRRTQRSACQPRAMCVERPHCVSFRGAACPCAQPAESSVNAQRRASESARKERRFLALTWRCDFCHAPGCRLGGTAVVRDGGGDVRPRRAPGRASRRDGWRRRSERGGTRRAAPCRGGCSARRRADAQAAGDGRRGGAPWRHGAQHGACNAAAFRELALPLLRVACAAAEAPRRRIRRLVARRRVPATT